jgi:hypothetical protein
MDVDVERLLMRIGINVCTTTITVAVSWTHSAGNWLGRVQVRHRLYGWLGLSLLQALAWLLV